MGIGRSKSPRPQSGQMKIGLQSLLTLRRNGVGDLQYNPWCLALRD